MAPKPKTPRGNSFVKFRASKGWTQAEMAKKLGYSREHYATIEALAEGELSVKHKLMLAAVKAANPK